MDTRIEKALTTCCNSHSLQQKTLCIFEAIIFRFRFRKAFVMHPLGKKERPLFKRNFRSFMLFFLFPNAEVVCKILLSLWLNILLVI